MSIQRSGSFLRRVLAADAASSAAMGVLLIAAAAPLDTLLGLPAAFLRAVGIVLLPFAAAVAVAALSRRAAAPAARAIAVANLLWVAASIGLLVARAFDPTLLGVAFVVGQAGFVAAMAALQLAATRIPAPAAA